MHDAGDCASRNGVRRNIFSRMPDSSRNALSALHEQLVDAMSTNDTAHDTHATADAAQAITPAITPELTQEISEQADRLTLLVEELGHEAQALLDQPTDRTAEKGASK